jgi:nicotinate dehydrogenase subunit B
MHARVMRPAAVKANLPTVDDSDAMKIPGFEATIRKDNFLAVVAKNEWAAMRASRAFQKFSRSTVTSLDWASYPS